MKKTAFLALLILGIAVASYAIRVNPGSQASGDSDNTAETLVYRDASGNFAAGTITAAAITATAAGGSMLSYAPTTQVIAAAGTVAADACGGLKRISADGAVTSSTTYTFTAPSSANTGCVMDVYNDGPNAITLDNNVLFMSAGAADVVLGASDTVRVGSNGVVWFQIGATGDN